MLLNLLSFIISAVLVYLSSRALTFRLIRFFISLTRSTETAVNLLFFLLLPGIFLHEFSHIISAELLRVPTGELKLKPQFKDNRLRLGSAMIAQTDPVRLTMIGTAPFIIGLFTLWGLLTIGLNLNLSALNFASFNQILSLPAYLLLIIFYLVFAISNTMFSSPSDLQSAGLPVVLFLLLLGSFKLINLSLPSNLVLYTANLFSLLSVIFFLVLILNLLLLTPLVLFFRRR